MNIILRSWINPIQILFTSFDLITSITTTPDSEYNGDNGSISLNFNALNVAPVPGSGSYIVKYYEGNSVTAPPAGDISMSANGVAFANLAGNGDGASDGVYTVVVFDNETGCATMARTLTIGFEPYRPNFTPVATGDASNPTRDNSVCDITLTGGTYNGQITINPDIAGTEASYTYAWFDGTGTSTPTTYTATDNVLSNLPAGNYTFKVTSILNNCDTTISHRPDRSTAARRAHATTCWLQLCTLCSNGTSVIFSPVLQYSYI
jgi:hypothetical protein